METGEIVDRATRELRKLRGADYDGASFSYLLSLLQEGADEFARDTRIVRGDIILDVEAEQPLYDVYQEDAANPAFDKRGLEVLEVWYKGRRLRYRERQRLQQDWEKEKGEPQDYFMYAADVIHLRPMPTEEITDGIKLYCVFLANRLFTREDEPNIPPEYHQALVWYITWREMPEDHPRAQFYLDRYLLNVNRAKGRAAGNLTTTIRHVKLQF